MGLNIVKEIEINEIVVMRDSMLIIKAMVNYGDLESNAFSSIFART
jgi:hypothetical protein